MSETRLVDPSTRDHLRRCVADLAVLIADGEITPMYEELQALAEACERQQLPEDAARVRRWMRR